MPTAVSGAIQLYRMLEERPEVLGTRTGTALERALKSVYKNIAAPRSAREPGTGAFAGSGFGQRRSEENGQSVYTYSRIYEIHYYAGVVTNTVVVSMTLDGV